MPLISRNPMRPFELVQKYAAATDKYILVIDNSKYHTLDDTKKATVYAYYEDRIDADYANWIIPEEEIDRIFELEVIYYEFGTKLEAVDACFDWFPQAQNLPDADHHIPAYVVTPTGVIAYGNSDAVAEPS